MTAVFVGGSRRLSRLNADVKRRIDTIIDKQLMIVVGDANGVDKAVQRYLAGKAYQRVTVFCMAGGCRNNLRHWPTREITAPDGARGFAYYSVKDRAMADDCSHGLMLWDGESKGTLSNVVQLVRLQKPVVVYFAPTRSFYNIRTEADLQELLSRCGPAVAERFEREFRLRGVSESRPLLP